MTRPSTGGLARSQQRNGMARSGSVTNVGDGSVGGFMQGKNRPVSSGVRRPGTAGSVSQANAGRQQQQSYMQKQQQQLKQQQQRQQLLQQQQQQQQQQQDLQDSGGNTPESMLMMAQQQHAGAGGRPITAPERATRRHNSIGSDNSSGSGGHNQPEGGEALTNDALKEEVRRLQLALVDKFRGRNKMIGGSQFRVSNPKKSGESDNCSDCAALRNGIKSLRFECRDLRSCVGDLQSQVSTERATRLALEQRATQDAIKWKAERAQMLEELELLRNQPQRSPVRSPVRDGGILQELQEQVDTLSQRLGQCEKEKQREATHRQ
eukprot:CAMPEP_0119494904 /NCGR_PEP_ID=MMETSP1344-20130328/18711_1 /TAXON_ID=236787 /ORGANISM="Florenciella parvula, Strain CCMP2471" /LENGTH=320 /DNA_ID=CAMNT_0007530449 /DNA_START=19 /DNA_END=978 /DNA_ORIENTATION=+